MSLSQHLARLERAVESDAGAPEYAALAEAYRRAGRGEEAVRVAKAGLERRPEHHEGLAVLCLALLDAGRPEEARRELERCAAAVHGALLPEAASSVELSEGELEQAFEGAHTDRSQVLDADRVAQEAMAHAALDEPEDVLPGPAFATQTMAELLDRQGDTAGASQIRAVLGAEPGSEAEAAGEGLFPLEAFAEVEERPAVATLERWLSNLRQLREAR